MNNRLVVGLAIVGVLILVVSACLSLDWPIKFGELGRFLSGLGVNVGTAVGLAGLLVALEPRILRRATRVTSIAARAEAERVVEEVTTDIRTELADLNRRIEASDEDRREARASLVDKLEQSAAREDVEALIRHAVEIGALGPVHSDSGELIEHSGQVSVRAGDSPSPFITYRCIVRDEPASTYLAVLYTDDHSAWVEWSAGLDPAEMVAALRARMVASGLGKEAQRVDAEAMFRNLRLALREAIAYRSGDAAAWIAAPIVELLTAEVAITTEGVDAKGMGTVAYGQMLGGWVGSTGATRWVPANFGAPPSGIPVSVWSEAQKRGGRRPSS